MTEVIDPVTPVAKSAKIVHASSITCSRDIDLLRNYWLQIQRSRSRSSDSDVIRPIGMHFFGINLPVKFSLCDMNEAYAAPLLRSATDWQSMYIAF